MNSPHLSIAIAQMNPLVGDIDGNCELVIRYIRQAHDEFRADAVLFPELVLTGYPPEDLLLREELYPRLQGALAHICASIPSGITALVGYPHREGKYLFNACAVIRNGTIEARYDKCCLPNYGVFDEKRYFTPGTEALVIDINGVPCGVSICEDIWYPEPAQAIKNAGGQVILNLNASPFHVGKFDEREAEVGRRIEETGLPVVYTNLCGGQDELVFDGSSFAMDCNGNSHFQAPVFESGLYMVELDAKTGLFAGEQQLQPETSEEERVWQALVTGVRDYVGKNRFSGAVIGLSGGIDSALTLAVAVEALGADAIEGVLMPSRYTADMSIEDARQQAITQQVKYHIVPIEEPFSAFLNGLAPIFTGTSTDTTEENIQARCRGIILMAISNKFGKIVLTTGNKSEMAVGYSTLYGDMAGGFAPLKDVPKMMVYRLARWLNRDGEIIPQRVIERPPSAELAPDQCDQDSLPPYEILDDILAAYIEQDLCIETIIEKGYAEKDVLRVVGLVNRNEYKRRQAAPGVKITQRSFGKERRYPITSGFERHRE